MMENKTISIKKIRKKLFLLGMFKIPMIGFIRPKLIAIDDDNIKVKVKLRRRTKNHLNSMYFGALAVGADLAAGVHAFYFSEKMGRPVSFAFKGVKADFLMRAETDVFFTINEGKLVEDAMIQSMNLGERVNQPVNVSVTDLNENVVAQFEMMISVKIK